MIFRNHLTAKAQSMLYRHCERREAISFYGSATKKRLLRGARNDGFIGV